MNKKFLQNNWISIFFALSAWGVLAQPLFAAEKTPIELEDVGIQEKFGAQADLGLTFREESGQVVPLSKFFDGKKPVLLLLAYYGCPNLCNFFLNGATDSFKSLKWVAGKDFEILTVSFDPREEPGLAAKKKESHLRALGRPEYASGWHFLVNNRTLDADAASNSKTLATQVGYKFKYNKAESQYAHAAGMVFLTPYGKVSRYLYGIEFKPQDLKFALQEASGNRIGNLVDRFTLFCYNYDPSTRKYAFYAMKLMQVAGGLTVLILAVWIWAARRRSLKPFVQPKYSESGRDSEIV